MTVADISDVRSEEAGREPAIWPGLAVAGILAAIYAAIRFRERRDPLAHRSDIPDSLREDVGLPKRDSDRGWWEWR